MLFNPFTFREIELRGLVNTGRAADAVRLFHTGLPDAAAVSPQWHIIERVTAGQVLLAGGQRDEAEQALRAALTAAEVSLLPHQIQRTIRAAEAGQLYEVAQDGRTVLHRLNDALAPVASPVL